MIAKTSIKPGTNSRKHTVPKLTTKTIFAASKQCECSINCSSLNSTGGTLNKISYIDNDQEKSDTFSTNSKACKFSKCTKKVLEKSSNFSKSKMSTRAKISNLNQISPPLNNSESKVYNDTVVTRSMRKRKRRWIDNGKSNLPLSNNKSFRIKTIDNNGESNCVRKMLKIENIDNSDVEIVEANDEVEKCCMTNETCDSEDCLKNKIKTVLDKELLQPDIKTITFEEWQKEASNKWAAYTSSECDCSSWQQGSIWSNLPDNNHKTGTSCSQERHNTASYSAYKKNASSSGRKKESRERISSNPLDETGNCSVAALEEEWSEPKNVRYREISGWPHLNDCIQTLEVLNIGGTNVLGEFIPFILLYAPRLKSLGQWINTMIYGKHIKCNRYKWEKFHILNPVP